MSCCCFNISSYFQAQKQLLSLSGRGRTEALDSLAQALGVAQHHDAVSGTARQHVTDDYSYRMSRAQQSGLNETIDAIRLVAADENEHQQIMRSIKLMTKIMPL